MKKIGLVFSGGGGKGAYQIGVWRALRELGLEHHVVAVSGTSVGALNAALFLKGNLEFAEQMWNSISNDSLMPVNFEDETAFFSNSGLASMLDAALQLKDRHQSMSCYVTCKKLDDGEIRYFELSRVFDPEYRKRILLASSAIPAIFPTVTIDGEEYVDGGANGDNVPVYPLVQSGVPVIIVVHLSQNDEPCSNMSRNSEIIDIFPSEDLGSLISGTLDFDPVHARQRQQLGYRDAMSMLTGRGEFKNDPVAMVPSIQQADLPSKQNVNISSINETRSTIINTDEERDNMEKIKFERESIQKQYDERIAQLQKIARSPEVTNKVLWDATVSKYSGTIEKVRALMHQNELKDEFTPYLDKQMSAFLSKCSKPEFHIALVGAIKAGKSSLINAILDEELASTEVTPETAALTKFRGSSESNSVAITFYSEAEWNKLWASASKISDSKFMEEYHTLNAEAEKGKWVDHEPVSITCDDIPTLKDEIQKWTSSRSAAHYFVKEVEVFLKDFALPEGVVLVDTPGLNDAVEYRSDITKNYIDRANAVFVCVKADKLSGPELATICGVFSNTRYNPEKVYIIATQQDALNAPIDDWKKQRLVWLGHLKEKMCYGDSTLAERNLLSTSGYFYTLLKNLGTLDENRKFALYASAMKMHCFPDKINEQYDQLMEFTGIATLKRRMNNEIIEKYRELLRDDIKHGYEQLKDSVSGLMDKISQRQEKIIETSSKSIDEIKAIEEENKKRLADAKKDQDSLEQLYDNIKKEASERKNQIARAIRSLGGV